MQGRRACVTPSVVHVTFGIWLTGWTNLGVWLGPANPASNLLVTYCYTGRRRPNFPATE